MDCNSVRCEEQSKQSEQMMEQRFTAAIPCKPQGERSRRQWENCRAERTKFVITSARFQVIKDVFLVLSFKLIRTAGDAGNTLVGFTPGLRLRALIDRGKRQLLPRYSLMQRPRWANHQDRKLIAFLPVLSPQSEVMNASR